MKRLKGRASSSDETPDLKRSQRNSSSSSTDKVIFKPDCIFCNKEGKISVIKNGYKTTEGVSPFDRDGGFKVFSVAEEIGDEKLLTRIRGYNLFSCEAKHHPTCRRKYLNKTRAPRE